MRLRTILASLVLVTALTTSVTAQQQARPVCVNGTFAQSMAQIVEAGYTILVMIPYDGVNSDMTVFYKTEDAILAASFLKGCRVAAFGLDKLVPAPTPAPEKQEFLTPLISPKTEHSI